MTVTVELTKDENGYVTAFIPGSPTEEQLLIAQHVLLCPISFKVHISNMQGVQGTNG